MSNDLTLTQQTILRALRDNESLRVHSVYYPDVFALSCRGLVTFTDLREDHWRGFEVRRPVPADQRMCSDCRGKGTYTGLDTCRRCNGSGMWRPAPEPTTTPRPPTAADDPDHFNPVKGGNRAGDDYW